MKGKGERKRFTQLNAGFQIVARRDKKAFLKMQRNRGKQQNGKIRDPLKKTGEIKGTFHAQMSTIKDRNGMDLTEAEEIMKWWQEYHRGTIQKQS